MLTKPQDNLYWREWGKAVKACKEHGWTVPDRHELHVKAIGKDKSHLAFTNKEFHKILGALRALSKPASVNAQLRQINQPRVNIVYKITVTLAQQLALFNDGTFDERLSAAERTIIGICSDKFRGETDITALSDQPNIRTKRDGTPYETESDLMQLLFTVARLVDRKRRDAGMTKAELERDALSLQASLAATPKLPPLTAAQVQPPAPAAIAAAIPMILAFPILNALN